MARDFSYPYFLGTASLNEQESVDTQWALVLPVYRDQIILTYNTNRQQWELPGGHCEPGETPAQTAARECYEETGSFPAELTLIGRIPAIRENGNLNLGLVYLAHIEALGVLPENSEIACIALVRAEQLDALVERPGAAAFYRDLLHFAGILPKELASVSGWSHN